MAFSVSGVCTVVEVMSVVDVAFEVSSDFAGAVVVVRSPLSLATLRCHS